MAGNLNKSCYLLSQIKKKDHEKINMDDTGWIGSVSAGDLSTAWVEGADKLGIHEPGYDFEKNEQMKDKIQPTRPSQMDVFNRYFRCTRPGLINKPIIYDRGEGELLLGSCSYKSEGVSEWVDCYPLLIIEHSWLLYARKMKFFSKREEEDGTANLYS